MWEGEHVLLDGHNRYAICQKHGLPFTTRLLALPDLEAAKRWMLAHQLGRRNLTPEQMSFLRGTQYVQEKHQGERIDRTSGKSYQKLVDTTAKRLAAVHRVSEKTLRNDAQYARSVDAIAAVIPDARQALLARDTKVSRQDVSKLATLASASPQAAKHVFEAAQASATPKAATGIIAEAAKAMARVTAQARSSDTAPHHAVIAWLRPS